MTKTRIALDIMGGDRAPDAILKGARLACSPDGRWNMSPERVLLVGDEARIQDGLAALGGNPGFAIRHATQVVGMAESPPAALRQKPDSSIAGMVAAIKKGEAGAAVSMGNTGAVVGAATIGLGTLPGVVRPGIAVSMRLTGHPLTLIDMGALLEPKPESLMQFGVMGSVYTRDVLGVAAPRVGLLNVGEEDGKGTDTLKAAFKLLKEAPVQFIGNIEGNDVLQHKADVVVTDGFTGNVVLKLMEDMARFMLQLSFDELGRHGIRPPADATANIQRQIDYSEYGGALLLGVAGVVIIGHGRSDETAVANALSVAARALDSDVNAHIVAGLEKAGSGGAAR